MGVTYKLNVCTYVDGVCMCVFKWQKNSQYVTVLWEHCILFLCPPLSGLSSTVLDLPLGHVRLTNNNPLLHWPTHYPSWNFSTNWCPLSCQGVRHLVIILACWVTPSSPQLCHAHKWYLFTGWDPSWFSYPILPDHHGLRPLAVYFQLSLKHQFILEHRKNSRLRL